MIPGLHYNGAKTKHSQDIAVLVLESDVVLSDYIMPACLDLDGTAGGIPPNQAGHVRSPFDTTYFLNLFSFINLFNTKRYENVIKFIRWI